MSLSQGQMLAPIPAKYTAFTANTAGTVVITGSGVLYGFYGQTVGTSWAITVYDNTAASGAVLLNFTNAANTFFGPLGSGVMQIGIVFTLGLTVVASGTAGTGLLLWQSFQ